MKKKEDASRLCVDYIQINEPTVNNKYMFPRINDLMDKN